jgi:hypothetical protein
MTTTLTPVNLTHDFLSWQVELRAHTMRERGGMPHVGVAPLLTVSAPDAPLGVRSHLIICGLLPAEARLAASTGDFRRLYEKEDAEGTNAYQRGIAYLETYYASPADFDPTSVTTMVAGDHEIVGCLERDPLCMLLFHVFDLTDRSPVGRPRTLELTCEAELHREGPVRDNVWWHNTLFHGPFEGAVVIRFRHRGTRDIGFKRG